MAMDYEWSIKVHERELAHLREMQALTRAHMDTHDTSFQVVGDRMERIETSLELTQATVREVAEMQKVTEQKMQSLIDILAREHSNGRLK
jgi:hypothetical protein